jgi:hypothetical protein
VENPPPQQAALKLFSGKKKAKNISRKVKLENKFLLPFIGGFSLLELHFDLPLAPHY